MFIRKPTTLKDALQVLRKDRMHDYNDYADTATAERVSWLGIWEGEIEMLRTWLPQVVVERRREGTEGFWRVDVALAKPTSRTLIIDELDVGGEIGEVALGLTDAALPNTLAMRRLPSGKLGWVDNCDLRLPVGLLPVEWHGRALLVTFSLAPDEASEAAPQAPLPVAE